MQEEENVPKLPTPTPHSAAIHHQATIEPHVMYGGLTIREMESMGKVDFSSPIVVSGTAANSFKVKKQKTKRGMAHKLKKFDRKPNEVRVELQIKFYREYTSTPRETVSWTVWRKDAVLCHDVDDWSGIKDRVDIGMILLKAGAGDSKPFLSNDDFRIMFLIPTKDDAVRVRVRSESDLLKAIHRATNGAEPEGAPKKVTVFEVARREHPVIDGEE